MSYLVTRTPDERPIVLLEDEPSYCKALEASPSSREPELNSGLWLIMVFASWSISDINAIQTALDTARYFEGKFNLAVRPFDIREEHATWCCEIKDEHESPLWILLNNGKLLMKHLGPITPMALIHLIKVTGAV